MSLQTHESGLLRVQAAGVPTRTDLSRNQKYGGRNLFVLKSPGIYMTLGTAGSRHSSDMFSHFLSISFILQWALPDNCI